jgi:hypothetical protein
MQLSHRRIVKVRIAALIGLLLTATGCQLVVNVSEYRFEDGDAGAELQPPSTPGAPEEPSDTEPAVPRPPATPALDAGSPLAPGPPLEDTPLPSPVASEPLVDAGAESPEPEPEPPLQPEPPLEPELPPDPMSGCSLIEYCYAYQVEDTTDEERCRQLGCSLDAASAECRTEVAAVCGSAPQPPFVMVTLSGERVILN